MPGPHGEAARRIVQTIQREDVNLFQHLMLEAYSNPNYLAINSQKKNDATTWDEMRKALIKSSETG